MSLIEKLGLEKCQEIVSDAPEWAKYWITRDEYHGHIISFPNMTGQQSYLIDDLRSAITNNNTDHCTDIRNHISPLTGVIER